MKCEDFRELIADYFAGRIAPGGRAGVEAHLASCEECSRDAEMWSRMNAWSDERPSPALRTRVQDLINAYRAGIEQAERPVERKRTWFERMSSGWMLRPAFQFGVALVCLAAGLAGGYKLAGGGAQSRELAQLQAEIIKTQRLVTVSLLQQQSASERLRGVSYSSRVPRADGEVMAALIRTVQHDTNVDVRLAAVDALARYAAEPVVRNGIVQALREPQSPLVHIALIDLAVRTRLSQATSVLRTIKDDPEMNSFVRERADWGLQQF